MDKTETRLQSFRLRQPPEALRERVLSAARPAPSEWRRLLRTVEGCTVAVLLVYAGCAWYEQGTETVQRDCRTAPPAVQEERITEQVARFTAELGLPEMQPYLAAQLLDHYHRPFVVKGAS